MTIRLDLLEIFLQLGSWQIFRASQWYDGQGVDVPVHMWLLGGDTKFKYLHSGLRSSRKEMLIRYVLLHPDVSITPIINVHRLFIYNI